MAFYRVLKLTWRAKTYYRVMQGVEGVERKRIPSVPLHGHREGSSIRAEIDERRGYKQPRRSLFAKRDALARYFPPGEADQPE